MSSTQIWSAFADDALASCIDRCIDARRRGALQVSDAFARCAQAIACHELPEAACAIESVASRKGDGHSIGSALAQRISPASAAAVNVIWLLRGARRPAIDALAETFRDNPIFNDTIRMLCARIMPPALRTEPVKAGPIETAAAYRR